MLLNTGSSHTWVLSDQANTKGFEKFFDKSKSSTFYDPLYGVRVGIQFGIGGLNGIFVQDRLTIGDYPHNSAVVEDFEFGLTSEASVFMGDFEVEMGLGYPGLNRLIQSRNGKSEKVILPFLTNLWRVVCSSKMFSAFT